MTKQCEQQAWTWRRLRLATLLLGFLCHATGLVFAQSVETRRGEVYGFGGIYHGEQLTAGTGGDGAAYTAHRHVRLFGEGYYFRKDISGALDLPGIEAKGSAFAFEGGAHILFPVGDTRVVPFGTGGVIRLFVMHCWRSAYRHRRKHDAKR